MKNIRSGTTFFLIYINGQDLQDLHLFCRKWLYNKKKFQMFVVNMTFISLSEVKKCIFHMKYTFFHFTQWNKSHVHSKHLNIPCRFIFIWSILSAVFNYFSRETYLTFTTLWENSSEYINWYFFSYFSQKIGFEISCKLSSLETVCL